MPHNAAQAVCELQDAPPHYLKLTIEPEAVNKSKLSANRSSRFDETSSTHSNMGDEDEFEITAGTTMYDIFGKEILVYAGENGQSYVSVEELKRHNFFVFKEPYVPHQISEEDYVNQLKLYLSCKAYKFQKLHQERVVIPTTSNSVINQVVNDTKNGKPVSTLKLSQTANTSVNNSSNNNHVGNRRNDKNRNSLNKTSESSQLRRPLMDDGLKESKENDSPNTNHLGRKPVIPEYNIVKMPLHQPLEVLVTYAVNDRRCYVYLKSREHNLATILRRVEIEAKKSTSVTPVVGQIYAAEYEGAWYRAVVQSVSPLKVLYIDYGNHNEVPLKEVRPLSKALCEEPAESVCINFGTNPIAGTLEYGTILNIVALRENSDHSYQVKKASEKSKEDENGVLTKTYEKSGNKMNEVVEVTKTITNLETKKVGKEIKIEQQNVFNKNNEVTKNVKQVELKKVEEEAKIEQLDSAAKSFNTNNLFNKLKQQLAFRSTSEKKSLNPQRGTIIESYPNSTGIINYLNNFDGNYICFILPQAALQKELLELENISSETTTDNDYKANLGDTVAIYKADEEKWIRGTVIDIKSNNYTVAFVDYGVIETTDKIRKLPKSFIDIGEFTCICKGSEKFLKDVKENDTLLYETSQSNKLKITLSDGTEEEVECIRWDPFVIKGGKVKIEEVETVFTIRPKQLEINSGELCKLSKIYNGKLMIKTKECLASYKKLKNAILEYNANPLKRNPQPSQLALCSYKNMSELHRVIILNIEESSVEVEYIDLVIKDTVNINSLRSISEPIATINLAMIPITLLGFEEGEYSEDILKEFEKLSENSYKFVAKHVINDTYDLISETTKESLSTMLKNLGKSDRCLYRDLPKKENMSGDISVVCLDNPKNNIVPFFSEKDDTNNLTVVTEATLNFQYDEGYVPIVDEICFAIYDDEWYRARVVEADPDADKFNVIYIDYGNKSVVSSNEIRKLNDNVKSIPSIAIMCKINDSKGRSIELGERYTIRILNKDENDFYNVDLI